jgi:hypothetical protein
MNDFVPPAPSSALDELHQRGRGRVRKLNPAIADIVPNHFLTLNSETPTTSTSPPARLGPRFLAETAQEVAAMTNETRH